MFKNIQHLSLKDKIDYIWTYYKIHILGTLFGLFMIFSLINSIFINPPPKEFVAISFLGNYVEDEKLENLQQIVNKKFLNDEDKKFSTVCYSFYKSDDVNVDMAIQTKFMALSSSKDLDILIGSKSEFDSLLESDYLADLGTLFPNLSTTPSIKTYLDKQKNIVGFYIEKSEALDKINFDYKDQIISITSNTQRLESSKEVLEFLIGQSELNK